MVNILPPRMKYIYVYDLRIKKNKISKHDILSQLKSQLIELHGMSRNSPAKVPLYFCKYLFTGKAVAVICILFIHYWKYHMMTVIELHIA